MNQTIAEAQTKIQQYLPRGINVESNGIMKNLVQEKNSHFLRFNLEKIKCIFKVTTVLDPRKGCFMHVKTEKGFDID